MSLKRPPSIVLSTDHTPEALGLKISGENTVKQECMMTSLLLHQKWKSV